MGRWAGPSWDPTYAIPEAARDDSAPGYDGFLESWRQEILADER